MAEFDFEGFGDFKSAFPPQPQFLGLSNQINGGITPGNHQQDDDWGDFIATSQSTPPNPLQFSFSNGFSHPPTPSSMNHFQTSNYFDPFAISKNNSAPPPQLTKNHADLDSNKFQKPKGPLPLSLFGEDEEEQTESVGNLPVIDTPSNLFDRKPAETVRNAANFNSVAVSGDIIAGLYTQDQQIKYNFNQSDTKSRLGQDLGSRDIGGDDEEWEFKDAFSENGGKQKISKEPDGFGLPGSKGKVITDQPVQDASSVVETKPDFIRSPYEFGDLFVASNGVHNKSSEMVFGPVFERTPIVPDSFMLFPNPGLQEVTITNGHTSSLGNDDADFDEFGDFMGAPSETRVRQEEKTISPVDLAEAHLPKEKVQEEQLGASTCTVGTHPPNGIDECVRIKQENHKGALPLSLFSDDVVGSDDSNQDLLISKPSLNARNGISSQHSGIPIHDLISTLYNQAPPSSFVDLDKKPIENGTHTIKMLDLNSVKDDDFDDGSWEFKDAFTETRVEVQPSTPYLGVAVQDISPESSDLKAYVELYAKLRDGLCLLLPSLIDDVKKSTSTDSFSGEDEKMAAFDLEFQEAHKVLQDNMASTEVKLDVQLLRENFLSEVLGDLCRPEFQLVESEYHLSKRLQLGAKDWRAAVALLRHAQSVLKVLTLGSEKEQSAYVSTWSRMITICAEELRHGASIWKLALDKNVRCQMLSELRGQQCIQALGEIYRVVELLRISAELYKPWILFSFGDPPSIFPLLDECSTLWSRSGLEETLTNLSSIADSGHSEILHALLESIKYAHDIDVSSIHDISLTQEEHFCQLSLLPEGTVPGLEMVLWDGSPYFLKLANLWANRISSEPPPLPRFQVS